MSGKSKTTMRSDLRLDLKDGATLWSNAELDRCIEKAVSDYSRFNPRELIYEESLQFTVTAESFTTPLDTDIDRVVDNESLTGKVSGDTCTIDGQPDIPRPLTVTIVDADNGITGLVITIAGFDRDGLAQSEVLVYAVGQSKTLAGSKYFNYVSSVTLTQVAGTLGAGDTIEVGIGAYTTVWVYLANRHIKYASETASTGVRNTDFYMDYANGRIKAISGGLLATFTAYTISYTKSQLDIDLSTLPDFIRVDQVEYPVGDIPQTHVSQDIWGKMLTITSLGEQESQGSLQEDKQVRVKYSAVHIPPTDYAPGSVPEFLENTILMAAGAYALFIYSLKQEHQAVTSLTSARAAVTNANSAHVSVATGLTDLKNYLDNNAANDAAGRLLAATTLAIATSVGAALDKSITYLDIIGAATTGDLALADAVWADYGATYVIGATAPASKKYLDDGDAKLDFVNLGGEGAEVPRAYREYAETVYSSIVRPYENKRIGFQQNATARANAALAYVQSASQRIALFRSYIEQANSYTGIAALFAREVEYYIADMAAWITEAKTHLEDAATVLAISDRFKAEAIERRNEVYAIWRDRKEYIGDYTASSPQQTANYSRSVR